MSGSRPHPKCVFNANRNFGGKLHNYPWCINPLNEMEGTNQDPSTHGLELTASYVGAMFSYAGHMLCEGKGSKALSRNCGGILGNKYVLELDQKCKIVDQDGNITGEETNLHKYIDNVTVNGGILTGGRPLDDCDGVIPSALSSAGKISPVGILNAFTGPTKPYCKKVRMHCHLIDTQEGGIQGTNCKGETYADGCSNYRGSGDIYLSIDDLKSLRSQNARDYFNRVLPNDYVNEATEPTGNDNFQNLNNNNYYSKLDSLFKEDELSKFYIASISILFLIILFRIINKR